MDTADIILAVEMLVVSEKICKYGESLPETMLLTMLLNLFYFCVLVKLFHILWKITVGSEFNHTEVLEKFVSLSLSLFVRCNVG